MANAFPVRIVDEDGFPVTIVNDSYALPNMLARWDFSVLSYLQDGSNIALVPDSSGTGNAMVQQTIANQPIKGTINGKSCGIFTSTKSLVSSLGSSAPLTGGAISAPVTFIFVVKIDSSQSTTSPIIFRSGTTNPFLLLLHNNAGTQYGIPYVSGNSLGNGIFFGPSIMDDGLHIIVITVETNITTVYVDGVLTTYNALGNLLGATMTAPQIGLTSAGFVGSVCEVIVLGTKLDQQRMQSSITSLNDKWGVGIENVATNGSPSFETNSTVDGSTVRIFTPSNPSEESTLVLWSHPQGQNELISPSYFAYPYVHASIAKGWYFAASSMGFAGSPGTSASSWGNPTAQTALLNLYNLMSSRKSFDNVILLGASMGGMASVLAIIKNTVPNVKAVYLIDPALNMLAMYKTAAYSGTIDLGYSINAGTLSSATLVGATSITSTVSFATGTLIIIDPLGVNPEQVITGSPTGSGPYTIPLTTPLTFAHNSAVKVSDYPTKIAGNDPMLVDISNFNGIPVRFLASTTDATVVQSSHTNLFKPRIELITPENEIVQHKGNHLEVGATNPRDFIDFVERNI